MDQCAGWSESVWLASHFVGLNFQELAQIYVNYNRNDKNYYIINALCEYRIILNVLIVCLFLKEITFSKNVFRNAIRAPNSLDPHQVPNF